MQNQLETLFFQIAEARRMHGVSERDGTIHQVYRGKGEQKVRVNIGMRPDGSPWLTPWLKVEDHHGSSRKQHKWHKGMNVKVSTVGADLLKATVTPHGENKSHPEPDHADDHNETEQFGQQRSRRGPDFEERWLASTSQIAGTTQTDPDKVSVVLTRWGAKPQTNQNDQLQPWEGPPPSGGTTQKRQLTWAGNAGNTPTQNGDAVVTQFDKDVKTEHSSGSLLQKVQSSDGAPMQIPDAGDGSAIQTTLAHMVDGVVTHIIHNTALNKVVSAIHKNGSITHTIQDAQGNISTFVQQAEQMIHQIKGPNGFSITTQNARQIMHQVGNSVMQILPSEININASSVNVNSTSGQGFSQPPVVPDPFNGNDPPLLGVVWPIGADLTVESVARGPMLWSASASLVSAARFASIWQISAGLTVQVIKQ